MSFLFCRGIQNEREIEDKDENEMLEKKTKFERKDEQDERQRKEKRETLTNEQGNKNAVKMRVQYCESRIQQWMFARQKGDGMERV